jgi:3-dehydroquinate dehydratase/shikimate dehydrogenase
MNSDGQIRICVPVCEKTFGALKSAAKRAVETADIIELRLDCLAPSEFEEAKASLDQFLGSLPRPTILTFRPVEEGGHRATDYASRNDFWSARKSQAGTAMFDIELDIARGLMARQVGSAGPDWSRIICSYHDYSGMPANLAEIYDRLANTPARVLKIAVQANDLVDCLPVFRLLERADSEGREVIAIAMGAAGVATRILGPSLGAFLTYGALESESATAPGQVTARELISLYRIHRIDRHTLICGLVGKPVMHSVSPHMHNAAFDSANINGVYLPFEVSDVGSFFKSMVHPQTREIDWQLQGLSITAPHKTSVMKYLDWIEPKAREIGAVNTVVVGADTLLGYNTDAEGMIEPLSARFGSLGEARVAVIGAGGAASAAVWGLQQQDANITLFARDSLKGTCLAERFNIRREPLSAASFSTFDIVINATPLGSLGETINETPATAEQLGGARLVYDLVYNPSETRLLQEARKAGCEILSGLEMLIAQARRQFKLWTGETADPSIMHAAATKALQVHS